ncbi:peroxiredoxin [Anaeromyxobacter oryzae]|uniref:Alkyl hydroperoxide reductase C n=1 Tax=Anaeromyxobacter oryzae TaxID=2918170 RepID=A0ABM7WR62_9BACT|nr:peroxiredoxin [Anaeromyxobacter oryzae]BDG01965.1 thioredoxin-like protein YkuU [Anaeromyxobacter oryzae]
MLSILDRAPDFKAAAVRGRGERTEVALADHAGRWLVIFFYPKDFTLVCPTEITELSKRRRELADLGADVVAISTDDVETHGRWIAEKLGEVAFPLAADPDRRIARAYGALLEREGIAARATFLVDPAGVVRYAAVHDLAVGRSVSEILRVLEALRTGEKAPAEWTPGTPTLGR